MTEPSDNTATRPISVAELLAKNGNIGAPAPGGRRRRRRGNAEAVTVAELTGEIPIIRLDEAAEPVAAEPPTVEETPVEESAAGEPETSGPDASEPDTGEREPEPEAADQSETEPDAQPDAQPDAEPDVEEPESEAAETGEAASESASESASAEPAPAEPEPGAPHRHAHLLKKQHTPHTQAGGAEEMTFDPLLDDDLDGEHDAEDRDAENEDATGTTRPPYLQSPDALFGGDSVADEAARRDLGGDTQKVAIADDEAPDGGVSDRSPFLHGFWVVVQSILAVVLGAGLFIAFDQLWKWNNIVALALSVLVILGLVVGVRVVRKTEDIASTLIAVAVGAMVTLGPLALLQST